LYACVPDDGANELQSCGATAFRETEVTIDGTPAGGGIKVSDPSDRFEREAEATADRVMSGGALNGAPFQRLVASDEELQGLFVRRQEAPTEEEPTAPEELLQGEAGPKEEELES